MHDVDRYGISNVIERAIEMVNAKMNKPIHVSFGVDVLDLDVCPGTGKPVNGGLTLREALFIGETINKTGTLFLIKPLINSETKSGRWFKCYCGIHRKVVCQSMNDLSSRSVISKR